VALFSLCPEVFQTSFRVEGELGIRPLPVEGFNAFLGQPVVSSRRRSRVIFLDGGCFFLTGEPHPSELLKPVEVAGEAMIAALDQLIGDPAHEVFQPLNMLLFTIDGLILLYPLLVLPGYNILGKGPVKCSLIVVENVFLAGTDLRVYFGAVFRAMPQEKLSNKPATAKRAKEATPTRSKSFNHCHLRV